MVNHLFIRRKIDLLKKYQSDLDVITDLPLAGLRRDFIRYYATERVVQLIVDEMTDINNHIISHNNFHTPDTMQSSFIRLSEHEVLPEDFAKKIAPVVGLRNRLVHRYEEIDKNLFLKMVQEEKEDFKLYVKYIKEYLDELK